MHVYTQVLTLKIVNKKLSQDRYIDKFNLALPDGSQIDLL